MNSQETEVKYYVKDLQRIEKRLGELGARLIQPRAFEINLRFDLPDGRLQREEKVLRLRQDIKTRLTFKGPSQVSEGVLSRAEHEITADDFNTARNLLEALGYLPVATYEKYRRTYEMEELHIMLDELPYGNFIEIEGVDTAALQKVSADLGLDFSATVTDNYLVLFERYCKCREGLDPSQLTFAALESLTIEPRELCAVPSDHK
jgi:adenylate cyclase class 2